MISREDNKYILVGPHKLEVPKSWSVQSLSETASLNMGSSPPSNSYNNVKIGLPFFQGNADFGSKYPTAKQWCSSPQKIADQNDILISVRAPVGELNIALYRCCIGRGLAAIKAKKVNENYLYYYLHKNIIMLTIYSQGSTFSSINKDVLNSFPILLPPLPEQKKIATILSTVDEAIDKTEQIIEKTKTLKKGLMQQLLTKGIGHSEFKETKLGVIPASWKIIRFGDYYKRRNEKIINNGYHYVGLEHIDPEQIYLSRKDTSGRTRSSNQFFKKNDVLFGKLRPYLKKAVLIDFDGICSTDILPICSTENSLNEFLIFIIHSKRFMDYATSTMEGTNLPRTSWSAIKNLHVIMPPLPEQKQIASILSTVDEKIQLEQQYKEKLELLKKGLMQKLLTGELRVKVEGSA